jgi:hypothetical protein
MKIEDRNCAQDQKIKTSDIYSPAWVPLKQALLQTKQLTNYGTVHNVLTCDADGHMFCYKLL